MKNQEEVTKSTDEIVSRKLLIIGSEDESIKQELEQKYKDSSDIDLYILNEEQLGFVVYKLANLESETKKHTEEQNQEERLRALREDETLRANAIKTAMKLADVFDKRNLGWFKFEDLKKKFKNSTTNTLSDIVKSLIFFELIIEDEKHKGLYKVICTHKQKAEFHDLMLKKRLKDKEEMEKIINIHQTSKQHFYEQYTEEVKSGSIKTESDTLK